MGKKTVGCLSAAFLVSSMVALSTPAADAATYTPSNPGPFTIPGFGHTTGAVSVTNATGLVTDVNITLRDLGHLNPGHLDLALVGPSGTGVVLMSDACGNSSFEDLDLTVDDESLANLSEGGPCATGTFRPTNFGTVDSWPTAVPMGGSLSTFDGINPNGDWTLFMVDDVAGDGGDLEGGFTLTITTAAYTIQIPADGSTGPASPYPVPIPVSGRVGKVADVNVLLPGLTHQAMADLDVLLVAPTGAKAMLMSDACSGAAATNQDYVLDDEATVPVPTISTCPGATYQPFDYALGPPDAMPAPAPAGPYPTALSAFDGVAPNGTWLLYVFDDGGGGYGFLRSGPSLALTTDATPPKTKVTKKPPTSTTKRKAKIRFTSNEAGSTFQCKVDRKRWKPCSSPLTLKNLKVGKHQVQIRAIDVAGNVETSRAKVRWRVRRS